MHAADGHDDTAAVEFDFLSHYLLGTTEHPGPPVSFDLQPAGPYLQSNQWPPAGTRFTKLYLQGAGGALQPASGLPAAGGLTTGRPKTATTASYFTNPAAGASMALNSYGTIAISPYVPLDQRLEEEQGLTWRTSPNNGSQVLAGPIQLHLAASSTATDTDWVARLSDVGPDGSESVVTEGALRASHRTLDVRRSSVGSPYHLDTDPQPLVAGRTYDFDVALIATGYRIAPGHALQLRLTTNDFPTRLPATVRFNPDDPAATSIVPLSPATNTVLQGGSRPSWLLLPIQAG
jgi:putative CocE/NonD family hydrolase